ncbi:MAG: DUF2029 domain-containing protein [Planctomycetes bacterium]|nr:DUF2029 domain-containing protein [Planctomycetota bacterium]
MSRPRVLVVVALAVAAAAFGWFDVRQRARLDRGPKYHRTDLTVYLAAADALARGDDPYEARSPRGWRYVYPPFLAVVARPLTALDVPDAALVWYALSVGALVAGALAVARSLGGGAGAGRASALALALAGPFVVQTLQRGQVTLFLLAVQAGATLAFLRGRDGRAGALLALGAALRLTPLLPAALLGLAALRAFVRGEHAPLRRLALGLAGGLALTFVVVPLVALGPSRALEVTQRWARSTADVYAPSPGEQADLARDYDVNEWSFKNQGVRRVAGTVGARLADEPLDARGRPQAEGREAAADRVALVVAALALAGAVALGWRRVGARGDGDRAALAVAGLLPALVTRYVWPVHLVVAVPLLAEGLRPGAPRAARAAVVGLVAGTALFYAAHAVGALRPLADAGVLLVAVAVALVLVATAPAEHGVPPGAPHGGPS